MNTKLIISANGPDRKGIVSEISSIISKHHANIETSKMIRLEQEFAILILIDIKTEMISKLNKSLSKIKNLSINLIETKSSNTLVHQKKIHLYINGADNEGIVYQFSDYLSKLDINIEEVNTKIKSAPVSATPLFMMDLVISSKNIIDENKLNQDLNAISEKLGVEIEIKKN
tara:strand:+ start:2575 stop:3090 length:516 start_codon:yes stop_codon:yes gene_type:complete